MNGTVRLSILAIVGVVMAGSTLTFDDLTAKVRRQLQDAEGNYWTDAEIQEYLDEGQLEYARKTRALRGSAPITVKENNETYRLPDDCLEVIRLEDSDGNEIPRSTSDGIQRSVGNFRNRSQGVPANASTAVKYAYSDLDGNGLIRLYPAPNPTVEEEIVHCQPYTRFGFTTPTSDDRRIRIFEDNYLYLATTSTIYRYSLADETFLNLDSTTWSHSLATFPDFQVVPANPADSRSGYFFFAQENGSDVISVATGFNQTISSFGTSASGNIKSLGLICPTSIYYASTIFYYAGTDIIKTSVFSFSETVVQSGISAVYQWALHESTRTIYVATAQGLYSIAEDENTMTQITSSVTRGVCSLAGDIYVLIDGASKIYKVESGALVEVVSSSMIPGSTANSRIIGDGISRLLLRGAGTESILYGGGLVYDVFLGEIITTQESINNRIMFSPGVWGDADGYNGRFYQRIIGDIVNYSDGDAGLCCVVNSILELTEPGCIVDLHSIEEDDIIEFSTEEGVACQVVQTSIGLYCYYVRSPLSGTIEIQEPLALTHYALYKCYEKDSDKAAMERAMYHLGQFQNILKRDIRRSSEGFNNARPAVQGYYF